MAATAEGWLPRSDGRTTCKRGHPWIAANVRLDPNHPTRSGMCRLCARELRAWREGGRAGPKPPKPGAGAAERMNVRMGDVDRRAEALAEHARAAHADPTIRTTWVDPWSLKPRPEPVARGKSPRRIHPGT